LEIEMFVPRQRSERAASSLMHADAGLFAWRGGGIVLLGEINGDRLIVIRGWLGQDKLTDVRRWSFASSRAFGGQVRRLALEATGDPREAVAAGVAATDWAASFI
jgi:hypothetical protein